MSYPDSTHGKAITLNLPVCPSLNNLFLNVKGRGRVKSPRYKAWLEQAGYALNRYVFTPVHGPVHVTICVPDKCRSDLDNLAKGPLDLLVSRGWIDDDRNVKSLHMIRDCGEDMRIDVRAA
jgi:crossover junction endodeoxyribonuclease RusA